MSAYEAKHHSRQHAWPSLGAKTMPKTDDQQHPAEPYHQYWVDRSAQAAQALRSRLGIELHRRLLAALPEEADDWSPQQWTFTFERVLRIIDRLPLGQAPDLPTLLNAARQPVSIHPYGAGKLARECTCGRRVIPNLLDAEGFHYTCPCTSTWTVLDDQARQRFSQSEL